MTPGATIFRLEAGTKRINGFRATHEPGAWFLITSNGHTVADVSGGVQDADDVFTIRGEKRIYIPRPARDTSAVSTDGCGSLFS